MFGKYKKKIKEANSLKELQSKKLEDDYMVGLYNGMELIIALMEGREPVFEDCISEPKVIQGEEEKPRRTAFSGVRRRGAN